MSNIFAVHDWSQDYASLIRSAGRTGYAVISESIGDDPNDTSGFDYRPIVAMGITPLARLNYSHHGQGTIPLPDRYNEFAQRCANYVTASQGCHHWLIGNEPNLAGERPSGVAITPYQYARCFATCRAAIKARALHHQVIVAAIAPYNVDTGWCMDYWREMLDEIENHGADGLALHFYSRGPDPASITSDAAMNPPYQAYHNGFRAYRDLLAEVPPSLAHLPTYATETGQIEAWLDTNSGWVRAAYAEIDAWNHGIGQKIHCLALYRWHNYDQWGFKDKHGVVDDFRSALAFDYSVADEFEPIPPEPEPGPEPPEPVGEAGDYLVEWDNRLDVRGVALEVAIPTVAEGEAWHVIVGEWFDEAQAQGRHNTYVSVLDENGNLIPNVPITWFWPDGQETKNSEIKNDAWLGYPYSADFGMYAVAPSYGVRIADGAPSDVVWGLGLGSIEQPQHNIHTSAAFTFQRMKGVAPVEPTIPHAEYVTALAGANLRLEPVDGMILIAVPYSHAVSVTGSMIAEDGYEWANATYMSMIGWIRADLLSIVQPEPAPEPEPDDELVHPLPASVITQHWGENGENYAAWSLWGHDGCDFGGNVQGSPIAAMADGVVHDIGYDEQGYGNYVMLAHETFAIYTMYAHAQEILVDVGQVVGAGDTIALVGSTGNSTGAHLHLEVRIMNPDGSYRKDTPMPRGRCDPETWAILYGLKL